MMDLAMPASRQELTARFAASATRGDWRGMVAAQQELAVRVEVDAAMAIQAAQVALTRATTRAEAGYSELSRAKHALITARDRAPELAEQAGGVLEPRTKARWTAAAQAAAAAIAPAEHDVAAAERRCQDNEQAVADAQARLDRLIAVACERVQPGRAQP